MSAIIAAEEFGFPRDKPDILEIVATFVKTLQRPNPFKNGIPGEDWFHLLQKCWKRELSGRKPEILTISRATLCNEEVVAAYVRVLGEVLTKLDLQEHPHHILNLDESGFVMDP